MEINSLIRASRMRHSLIKPGELAEALRVTRSHLTRMAKRKKFPGQITLAGGQLRFAPCEGLRREVKAREAKKIATLTRSESKKKRMLWLADDEPNFPRSERRFYEPKTVFRMRSWAKAGLEKIRNREIGSEEAAQVLRDLKEVTGLICALQQITESPEE